MMHHRDDAEVIVKTFKSLGKSTVSSSKPGLELSEQTIETLAF